MADLKKIVAEINKKHGNGTVSVGNQSLDVPKFSSGVLSVDMVTGGGYPWGRVIEVFGDESSGKTTLGGYAISEVQKLGHVSAFVDLEHAIDPSWQTSLGVKMEELIVSQPDSAEAAFDVTEALARSGAIRFILFDSIAAAVPKAELEGEYGDAHMGLRARLMGQFLRRVTPILNKNQVTLMMLNQTREKIGVFFGDPTTTPGGKAVKFAASQRIRTYASKKFDNGKLIKIRVIKNKVGPPFRKTDFRIIEDTNLGVRGVDIVRDIFWSAVAAGIVIRNQNTYNLNGTKLAVGKDAALAAFRKIKDYDAIRADVLKYYVNSVESNLEKEPDEDGEIDD